MYRVKTISGLHYVVNSNGMIVAGFYKNFKTAMDKCRNLNIQNEAY